MFSSPARASRLLQALASQRVRQSLSTCNRHGTLHHCRKMSKFCSGTNRQPMTAPVPNEPRDDHREHIQAWASIPFRRHSVQPEAYASVVVVIQSHASRRLLGELQRVRVRQILKWLLRDKAFCTEAESKLLGSWVQSTPCSSAAGPVTSSCERDGHRRGSWDRLDDIVNQRTMSKTCLKIGGMYIILLFPFSYHMSVSYQGMSQGVSHAVASSLTFSVQHHHMHCRGPICQRHEFRKTIFVTHDEIVKKSGTARAASSLEG